jgi:hypothetical protein
VYSRGASGCATALTNGLYEGDRSAGVGCLADGVFDTTVLGLGRQIELTTTWSVVAAYEHLSSAQWRTSIFGGYVDVSYDNTAKRVINTHLPAGPAPSSAASLLPTPCSLRSDNRWRREQ